MNPNNVSDSQTFSKKTSPEFRATSSEPFNPIIPQIEQATSSIKRSKANIVTMIVLLIDAVIGLFVIISSLNAITNTVANPADAGRGLATILTSISMVIVAPITFVAIFFVIILALNLKALTNAKLLSIDSLKSYVKKTATAGVLGILIGAVLVLLFVNSDKFKFDAGFDFFFQVVSLAIVPVTVLIFVWSFIYLVRAHRTQAIITSKSVEGSQLFHEGLPRK